MRPLASIYSHRVPGFMEIQVGFNPIQKRNSNPKRKVQSRRRSTGRSTDPCLGRPTRSTAPTREQSHFSRSTGAGRPLLPVHAVHAGRPASSTSRPGAPLACSMRRFSLLCRPISVLPPFISSISSLPQPLHKREGTKLKSKAKE